MIGVFTMGFGIMASVVTNNVSALAALANALLPLRKVERPGTRGDAQMPGSLENGARATTSGVPSLWRANPGDVPRFVDRLGIPSPATTDSRPRVVGDLVCLGPDSGDQDRY
jgi:hypothetical protein